MVQFIGVYVNPIWSGTLSRLNSWWHLTGCHCGQGCRGKHFQSAINFLVRRSFQWHVSCHGQGQSHGQGVPVFFWSHYNQAINLNTGFKHIFKVKCWFSRSRTPHKYMVNGYISFTMDLYWKAYTENYYSSRSEEVKII